MLALDSALGVEITESRLTMVSVRRGLQDYAVGKKLVVDEYRGIPRPELARRVKQFVQSNGFNRENVVLGLAREMVIVREIELPLEVEENLDQVLEMQVEKFEPSEEEHSYFDHTILRRDEETKRILIQVLMARQSVIDEVLELFGELDLYPAKVRHTSNGLPSLLHAHSDGFVKKDASLLIRVEESKAEFLVLSAERGVYSEAVSFDEELTADLLMEEAVRFVGNLPEVVNQFSNIYLLGGKAKDFLGDFKSKTPDSSLLSQGMQLKTKALPDSELEGLLPAIGLAISGVKASRRQSYNLIPKDKRFVGTRPSLVPTFFLSGLLLLCLGALLTRDYFQRQSLVDQIDAQIQALQPQVDEVFRLREQTRRQQAELSELGEMMKGRQKAALVLRDLSDRIPDDTYLQNLQLQGQQLTLQGYSEQASNLLPVLLESPYLENVKTNWITQDPRNAGKDRFNFAATVKE